MFLYFVPGRHSIDAHDLAGLGLAYILDRGGPFSTCGVVGAGPSGGSGVVFASFPPEETGLVRIDLDKQTWRPIPGSSAWVGHYTDRLPTPATLARDEQLAGHWLELLDGNSWRVPMARGWSESDAGESRWRVLLPQRLDLAADGRWVNGAVVARYQPLWELCEAWLNERCGQADGRLANQGDIDAAVLCLQANYKIGRVEAALLGILSDELIGQVLDCLIDWPGWLAHLKKNAPPEKTASASSTPPTSSGSGSPASPPAGSSSSAGPAAAIPATAPPAPTSPP